MFELLSSDVEFLSGSVLGGGVGGLGLGFGVVGSVGLVGLVSFPPVVELLLGI